MKRWVLALITVCAGWGDAPAQDTLQHQQSGQQHVPSQREWVRMEVHHLPEAVRRSLEGTEYRGWLINAAYRSEQGSADDTTRYRGYRADEVLYLVELKNGAQNRTVIFDEEGYEVEGKYDGGAQE